MQRERRSTPYPWTWEIPAVAALTVLLTLILGVHLGRALANLTAGAGWSFTPQTAWFTTLPALLGGDAAAGLKGLTGVASAGALRVWIGIVDLVLLAAVIAIAVWAWGRFGPSRTRGLATRAEAEALLGLTRLRRVAPVVRPDLHRRGGSR